MDLFSPADAPQILVEDAEGGIRYWPEVVDTDCAQVWFETLRDGAAWQAQRRPMYDRVVDVPRLLASYRIEEWPSKLPLQEMLAIVQARAPAPYNAVGLNLYRDGRDSVAMHNDKLHTIFPGFPISLISLGNARRMNIRAKNGSGRAVGIDLEPGSLLVMSHASQLTHEHGIPKTAKVVGPRMSAVFRVRPLQYAE
jgi:alkylated DNA repair dioxygenase AlkB